MESTLNRNERPVHHTPRRRRRNDILEIGIIASLTVGSAFYESTGDECERVAVPIVEGRGTTCVLRFCRCELSRVLPSDGVFGTWDKWG